MTTNKEILLPKLTAIQKRDGYISEESMKKLSEETGIQIAKIYGAVTFYSFLSTEKKGKHFIRVCNSPSCYINGSENVLKHLEDMLGIRPGETSLDNKYYLEITQCIGCCDEGPAILIDNKAYTKLTKDKLKNILENEYS